MQQNLLKHLTDRISNFGLKIILLRSSPWQNPRISFLQTPVSQNPGEIWPLRSYLSTSITVYCWMLMSTKLLLIFHHRIQRLSLNQCPHRHCPMPNFMENPKTISMKLCCRWFDPKNFITTMEVVEIDNMSGSGRVETKSSTLPVIHRTQELSEMIKFCCEKPFLTWKRVIPTRKLSDDEKHRSPWHIPSWRRRWTKGRNFLQLFWSLNGSL